MGTRSSLPKSRQFAIAILWLLGIMIGACGQRESPEAAAPLADSTPLPAPLSSEVQGLLQAAERARTGGDLGLALIKLKNAVRLAPRNGGIRAQLGLVLLKSGDTRTAQRELRQAWMDGAPEALVIPAILDSMVVRGEARDLLTEFPEPLSGKQSTVTPDILRARALALQILGHSAEANETIARSLSLRRDSRTLTASAKLATQQGDTALAQRMVDDALKLSPTNEDVLVSKIALIYQRGDMKRALAAADEFVRRVPQSIIARVIKIEVLLELKQDGLAREELDMLLMQSPVSSYGPYYRGVLLARADDFKGAWREAQILKPEFVLSQPGIAMMVAEIAIGSGYVETGGAILAALVSRRPELEAARIRLAAVQITLKDPDTALKTLDPLKTSDEPQVQAILGQANLQLGHFSDAIGAFEKAISSGSADYKDFLKRQLAQSAFELGDMNKAIRNLQEIEARVPGNWDVAIPLIASLVEGGKPDQALDVVNRMAKDGRRTPLAAFYRGRVLGAQGDLVGASAAFAEALAIDPKFIPALYFRAHVFAARGNPEAAKKDLQQVLVNDPTNVYAYIALAQIALYEGQESQSIGLLRSAVNVSPNDPAPRLALANHQVSHGKFQDALATLNALLQVSPYNPQALAQMGQIQFMTGQADRAVETLRSLTGTYPSSPATYVLLAKALNAAKDRLAAIDAAKKAVELDPLSVQIRSILIEYLIVGGRPDEALTNAREYSARRGPDADLLLANTLVQLKRADEANAYLTSRFAAKPDRLLALQLSQIAMSMGDRKKAVAVLFEWLQNKPADFEVRRQYASLLSEIGDTGSARKEFEALLKQRPEDPVVLNNLGWSLRDEDPSRAFSLISLAAKVAPDSAQIMDTLAWIKFQRRDLQAVLLLLRRAHELDSGDGGIGYHFALALDATGRRPEAKTLLQLLIAKNTEFSDRDNAKQLLARW